MKLELFDVGVMALFVMKNCEIIIFFLENGNQFSVRKNYFYEKKGQISSEVMNLFQDFFNFNFWNGWLITDIATYRTTRLSKLRRYWRFPEKRPGNFDKFEDAYHGQFLINFDDSRCFEKLYINSIENLAGAWSGS